MSSSVFTNLSHVFRVNVLVSIQTTLPLKMRSKFSSTLRLKMPRLSLAPRNRLRFLLARYVAIAFLFYQFNAPIDVRCYPGGSYGHRPWCVIRFLHYFYCSHCLLRCSYSYCAGTSVTVFARPWNAIELAFIPQGGLCHFQATAPFSTLFCWLYQLSHCFHFQREEERLLW